MKTAGHHGLPGPRLSLNDLHRAVKRGRSDYGVMIPEPVDLALLIHASLCRQGFLIPKDFHPFIVWSRTSSIRQRCQPLL